MLNIYVALYEPRSYLATVHGEFLLNGQFYTRSKHCHFEKFFEFVYSTRAERSFGQFGLRLGSPWERRHFPQY